MLTEECSSQYLPTVIITRCMIIIITLLCNMINMYVLILKYKIDTLLPIYSHGDQTQIGHT